MLGSKSVVPPLFLRNFGSQNSEAHRKHFGGTSDHLRFFFKDLEGQEVKLLYNQIDVHVAAEVGIDIQNSKGWSMTIP